MKKIFKKILIIVSLSVIITVFSASEYGFCRFTSKVFGAVKYSDGSSTTSDKNEDIENAVFSQDEPNIFLTLLSDSTVFVGDLMENLLIDAMGTAGTPTIDSVVFNEYLLTRIDYFRTNVTVDSSNANTLTIMLKEFVSNLYVTLVAIVTVIYIFILVYVGIRVVMTSVADQQAKYKQMLTSWAIGLLLLFTFHYIMSYIIEVNDLTVNFVRTNFASSKEANDNIAILMDKLKKEGVETTYKKLTPKGKEIVGNEAAKVDSIPNTSEYFELYTSVNIVKAVVWIILLGKTILIVIFYIKRLIMITFLILVFPFVTIAYVLNRVKEGKSKVFDTWFKAFFTNVFNNLLQAIAFIIVQFALAAEDWGWILPVVAILFFDKIAEHVSGLLGISSEGGSISSQIKTTVELSGNMIKDIKAGISGKQSSSDSELRNEIKNLGALSGYMKQSAYNPNSHGSSSNNSLSTGSLNGNINGNLNANLSNGSLNTRNSLSASVSANANAISEKTDFAKASLSNSTMANTLNTNLGVSSNINSTIMNSTSSSSSEIKGESNIKITEGNGNNNTKGNATIDNITVNPTVNVSVKSTPKVDVSSVLASMDLSDNKSKSGSLSSALGSRDRDRDRSKSKSSEKDEKSNSQEKQQLEETEDDYIDTVLRNSGIDPSLFTKEEKEKIFKQQIDDYKKKSRTKMAKVEKRKNKKDDTFKNINTNITDID